MATGARLTAEQILETEKMAEGDTQSQEYKLGLQILQPYITSAQSGEPILEYDWFRAMMRDIVHPMIHECIRHELRPNEVSSLFTWLDLNNDKSIDVKEMLPIITQSTIDPIDGTAINFPIDMGELVKGFSRETNTKLGESIRYLKFESLVRKFHPKMMIWLREYIQRIQTYMVKTHFYDNIRRRWINNQTLSESRKHPGYMRPQLQSQVTTAPGPNNSAPTHSGIFNLILSQVDRFIPIFQVKDGQELGVGRDVTAMEWSASPAPKSLHLHCVWKIQNDILEQTYQTALNGVKRQVGNSINVGGYPLERTHLGDNMQLGNDSSVNEVWLLHGTTFELLPSILANGLNTKYANIGGMFGAGNYFADTPTKNDQYANLHKSTATGDDAAQRALYQLMFPHSNPHPGGLHYLILCKVILGQYLLTDQAQRTVKSPTESIWSTGAAKRELITVPGTLHPHHSAIAYARNTGLRFNEYISFNNTYVLPVYLLAYQRFSQGRDTMLGGNSGAEPADESDPLIVERLTELHALHPSIVWTVAAHYGACGQNCQCCRSIHEPIGAMGRCKMCDEGRSKPVNSLLRP